MTALPVACALAMLCMARPAFTQSVSAEADITAGATTDGVTALATQGRLFGELVAGWRYLVEASWGRRSADKTDAFGSAYPYTNRVRPIETYVERVFQNGKAVAAIRAGRYRTPFGLSSRGDHAYNGFLRAPLIRYDGYFALSNNYLEHGASALVGTPALQVQASFGRPADVGTVRRRPGLDTAIRAQAFRGPMIVGVSFSRSLPYQARRFPGHAVFTGVDARVTHNGIQLRGEWIGGHPFEGTSTHGGYVDLIVHRQRLGPLTLVGRAEYLDYDAAAPFARNGTRYAIGGRLRLPRGLTAQADIVRQTGNLDRKGQATALDVALTYSLRWR